MAIRQRFGFDPVEAADFNGVSIPGGARHWIADPNTTFQTFDGWGVLWQIGQAFASVNDSTPPWQDEAASKLVGLGITIMGANLYLGLAHSDADYFTAWQVANFPGTGDPARDDYAAHRHHPINTSNWYFSEVDWHMPFVVAFRNAAIAAGASFDWYVKISNYYGNDSVLPGDYDPASFPARSATTVKKMWDHIQANYAATIGYPYALDTMNETAFGPGSTWNTTELSAYWTELGNQLEAASYTLPQMWGPSYQDSDLLTASNADILWNLESGRFRNNMMFTSHIYGATGALETALDAVNTVTMARTGGWINTELPTKPLGLCIGLNRGYRGSMNFSTAASSATACNDLFQWNAAAPVGSQLTEQNSTRFNKHYFRTIRPGNQRILATPVNVADAVTDEAQCTMWKDGSGKVRGVAVTNKANAIYVQVPAGRYRVKKTVGSYVTATGVAGTPTITVEDDVGVTYDVAVGQGIYLNGLNSNAAGVYAFVQES